MSDRGSDDSKPSTAASSSSDSSSSSSSSSLAVPQPSDASSTQIQVFARIRPSKHFSPTNLQFDPYNNAITLTLPNPTTLPTSTTTTSTSSSSQHADQFTRDYINNQRSVYPFTFHGLFPLSTSQATVFDVIGKQCVASLLDGYNSTIFAYGQTGSGKLVRPQQPIRAQRSLTSWSDCAKTSMLTLTSVCVRCMLLFFAQDVYYYGRSGQL